MLTKSVTLIVTSQHILPAQFRLQILTVTATLTATLARTCPTLTPTHPTLTLPSGQSALDGHTNGGGRRYMQQSFA